MEIVKAMAVTVVLAPVLFAVIVVFSAWLALMVAWGAVVIVLWLAGLLIAPVRADTGRRIRQQAAHISKSAPEWKKMAGSVRRQTPAAVRPPAAARPLAAPDPRTSQWTGAHGGSIEMPSVGMWVKDAAGRLGQVDYVVDAHTIVVRFEDGTKAIAHPGQPA
jgi:hypothetical protein